MVMCTGVWGDGGSTARLISGPRERISVERERVSQRHGHPPQLHTQRALSAGDFIPPFSSAFHGLHSIPGGTVSGQVVARCVAAAAGTV